MPTYPVKQPDGQLAVWSTVVDHFLAFDCDVDGAAHIISMRHSGNVREVCEQVAAGEKPFDHFEDWEDLVGQALGRYGEEDQTVQWALERTPDRRYPDLYAALWRAEGRMQDAEYEAEKLQKEMSRQREALLILRKHNRVKHDLDAYLLDIADWGLGQLKDLNDQPTSEKPLPADYGLDDYGG